jgi:hypothetical protein
MRTARLLVPLAALALLAGCAADTEEPEATPDRTEAETEDVRPKSAPESGEDEPADDADAPTGDLAACILGEWTADTADLVATTDAMLAAMGMTSSSTVVTGESRTTIDATSISTTYVEQVTESTIDVGGQQIVSRARMNGTLVQPYTLEGDVLTSVSGDLSGVEMESTVLVDGQELPGYSEGFQQGLSAGSAAGQTGRQRVTCTSDTLTMTTLDLAGLGMADITVTMTRG